MPNDGESSVGDMQVATAAEGVCGEDDQTTVRYSSDAFGIEHADEAQCKREPTLIDDLSQF